ncbi:pyroglutamyl-peptidase I [Bacteriovorax sp. Seq25_V]|uniref:pyroglutamyl-peptidase I n=1 Tax=Bacteriovorax sp. Seq25_V TaxID=1201288 RepID=UPI00038A390F|nr:pyroglutamyl-peptidase I [Bacteriovorax sp. Seq25_V]EQC47351.1 putative pyroglutamyl-peptidase I [Bacteriovorax sp. Seq25_V]
MTILISGFVPFGEWKSNPTERLVEELESDNINTILLPVSYDRAFKELENTADILRPDTLIMLGVAGRRKCISLERIAINVIDAEIKDNDGYGLNGLVIEESGPDGIFTNMDLLKIYETYDQSRFLPLEISNTAGTYVCNYLYYRALSKYKNSMNVLFIHVPPTKDEMAESEIIFDDLKESVRSIIKNFSSTK